MHYDYDASLLSNDWILIKLQADIKWNSLQVHPHYSMGPFLNYLMAKYVKWLVDWISLLSWYCNVGSSSWIWIDKKKIDNFNQGLHFTAIKLPYFMQYGWDCRLQLIKKQYHLMITLWVLLQFQVSNKDNKWLTKIV